MSDRINHSDIWDPALWDDTEVKQFNKTLMLTDELLVKIAKDGEQIAKQLDFSSLRGIQKVNKEFAESNKIMTQSKSLQEKRLKLEMKLMQAKTEEAKSNAELNEQLKQQNKLNREAAKERLGITTAIDKERRKLRQLIKARESLTLEGNRDRKASRALEKQIRRTSEAIDRAEKRTKRFKRGLTGLRNSIDRVGRRMLTFVGAAAAFRVIGNATKTIISFQKANADLAGVLDKTRSEIADLSKDARRLGGSTIFTASQVTKLQKEFAKLGFSQREILGVTEATLTLATATSTELPRAAEVVGNTLRAFQLDSSETQRVVDLMTKSFNVSALDMERFSTAMSTVAPVARTAGFSIERTTAILGTLASNGIDASTAGTALRNIFLELSKSGLTFEEAMSKINNASDKNATALELFGKRGAAVATIIADNTDQISAMNTQLEKAGGTAERVAETQMNTLSGQVSQLSSAWEGFILNLESGDGVIARVLRNAIELATDFVNSLDDIGKSAAEISEEVRIEVRADAAKEDIKEFNDFLKLTRELEGDIRSDREIARRFLRDDIAAGKAFLLLRREGEEGVRNALKDTQVQIEQTRGAERGELVAFRTALENLSRFDEEKLLQDVRFSERRIKAINEQVKAQKEIGVVLDENEEKQSSSGKKQAKRADEELTRLQQLRKDLQEVQAQREENFAKNRDLRNEEFLLLTKNAEGLQNEIDFLEEVIDLKLEKIELEKEDTDTIEDRIAASAEATQKSLDDQLAAIEAEEKAKQDALEAEKMRQQELAQLSIEGTKIFLNQLNERSEAQEQAFSDEIERVRSREQELASIARTGQLEASESLAAERAKIAELERQRLEEQKRQERIKLALATLDLLQAKIAAGSANPAQETGNDILQLVGVINSIPQFVDGTDDTGTVPNAFDQYGGRLAMLHDNEAVFKKEHNKVLRGSNKRTNDDVVDIVKAYDKGLFMPTTIPQLPMQVTPFMTGEQISEKFDELKTQMEANTRAIENKPVQWFELDDVTNHIVEYQERRGKIIKIHHDKKIEF